MFEFLFFLSYMKSNTIKTLSIIGLSICLILFRVTDGAEGTLQYMLDCLTAQHVF